MTKVTKGKEQKEYCLACKSLRRTKWMKFLPVTGNWLCRGCFEEITDGRDYCRLVELSMPKGNEGK